VGERTFDPEAVANFQAVLQADLTYLEETIIPRMRDGDLSYAPAFGLEGVEGKKAEYQASFGSIWTDIQYIKSTIKQMLKALDEVVESNADTEDVNVTEIDQFLSMGEDVPTDDSNISYDQELT